MNDQLTQKAKDLCRGLPESPNSLSSKSPEKWFSNICSLTSDYLFFARVFYKYPLALRAVTDGRIVMAMVMRPLRGPSAFFNLNDIAHPSLKLQSEKEKQAYAAGLQAMRQDASSGSERFLPGDILLVESLARDDSESFNIANEVIKFSQDLFV